MVLICRAKYDLFSFSPHLLTQSPIESNWNKTHRFLKRILNLKIIHIYFNVPNQIQGDPLPMVTWHRENGELPEGRSRILLDNTLRMEDTRPEDQGRYICKGHNEGGNVSVAVKILVYGEFSQ